MASILKVDKLDPQSGTALEIGTSGDTVSLPSGATLDISASTLTPPATMPASSGINFTALNATNLGSGTVPTARLGTGTASSSTVLYGDQTYKAEPGGITMCDTWGHSANQAISANTATTVTGYTNWGSTNGGGSIGSALTVSSGIFTFPETGYYYLSFEFQCFNSGSSANDGSTIYMETTVDDSSYTDACDPTTFFEDANDHIGLGSSFIFDVTDTANIKFKFVAYSADTDMTVAGHTTRLRSGFNVIRLGDT
jgi:hypothetical protein